MKSHDCAEILRDDALRILGTKHFQISQCENAECVVCLDDQKDIVRLTALIKKYQGVLDANPTGIGDDTLMGFMNLSDEISELAISQLGEEFSPY